MPKKKLVRGPLKSKTPGYKIPYPPTPKGLSREPLGKKEPSYHLWGGKALPF